MLSDRMRRRGTINLNRNCIDDDGILFHNIGLNSNIQGRSDDTSDRPIQASSVSLPTSDKSLKAW